MRKLIFTFLVFLTLSMNAQDYTVRFLGIPVDGTKKEMISKLKKKGFKYDRTHDLLEGQFNNREVIVSINTYKEKVWRIVVMDKYVLNDEVNIRIRYNQLIDQFENNAKYSSILYDNKKIEDTEDISYEIHVNNKRYQATFTQGYSKDEIAQLYNDEEYLKKWITNEYSENELDSLRIKSDNEEDYEERIKWRFAIEHSFLNTELYNNTVWFIIGEQNSDYYIVMYYENDKNEPKGEDL
ncbi:MAG: hypothetical protein IKU05_07605 [Bacteroidales bacterium]|nr:hypothetical protein [Bacteroidales bacterium]